MEMISKEEFWANADKHRASCELAATYIDDDADALECIDLFMPWTADRDVLVGERLKDNGMLWEVIQAHHTQEGWEPENVPALFKRVVVDEWIEWEQPTCAADAFMIGDKRLRFGTKYICTANYNVYPPEVFGWELYEV